MFRFEDMALKNIQDPILKISLHPKLLVQSVRNIYQMQKQKRSQTARTCLRGVPGINYQVPGIK